MNIKQPIEYYTKSVYGSDLEYIVDKDVDDAIRRLTRQKTISPGIRDALTDLGLTFVEVLAPRK